jgi:hypothetical protein
LQKRCPGPQNVKKAKAGRPLYPRPAPGFAYCNLWGKLIAAD